MESRGVLKTSGTVGTAFKTLLQLGSTLSELDPTGGSKIAFVLCTKAWEHMEQLEKQAADLDNLVQSLARMTLTIESVQKIADANLGDTVMAMLNLIEDASLFILNYKSRSGFAQTFYSIMDPTAQNRIQDFVQQFKILREEFDSRAGIQVLKAVESAADRTNLKELGAAGNAGYYLDRGCAPGTRERIIDEIVNWSQEDAGRKLLWVHGFAGLGKTSVASSVCQRLKEQNRLAASFFCKRDDPSLHDSQCLLNTIVYRLATQPESYRHAVMEVIQEDPEICAANIKIRYIRKMQTRLQPAAAKLWLRPTLTVVEPGCGCAKIGPCRHSRLRLWDLGT
ncbi:hypothetical protein FRC10_004305 [Ceratobasidium sp. 414]|nr:hypothetical protein FRC10_004305 [Ceratobasidium sp. 414]